MRKCSQNARKLLLKLYIKHLNDDEPWHIKWVWLVGVAGVPKVNLKKLAPNYIGGQFVVSFEREGQEFDRPLVV